MRNVAFILNKSPYISVLKACFRILRNTVVKPVKFCCVVVMALKPEMSSMAFMVPDAELSWEASVKH